MRGMRQRSMATSPGCRLIGAVVYRELSWAKMPGVPRDAVQEACLFMLLIRAASAFGFYMSWERLPPRMAPWVVTLTSIR